jgi:dTDP-4-dehydrorhamnose reductase
MRILVIGGDGMLGHQLCRHMKAKHTVGVTLRRPLEGHPHRALFSGLQAYGGIDVRDAHAVREAVRAFAADAVVNAAGVVKQRGEGADAIHSIEVNGLFPHRLAEICRDAGAYLVHYSTDCVFSGRKGAYREDDLPDPIDLYGRSKLIGELDAAGCITLRTSMIGAELDRKTGLLEWFLRQKGKAPGYRRAVFSGLSTPEQARVAELVLNEKPRRSGIYHLSAEPINKFDLLCLVATHYRLDTLVVPDDSVVIDRSLDSARFRADFAYRPPAWSEMIAELAQ